jgi:hypothetical protein
MHPFACAGAHEAATAGAARADDPELAFIAGGADLFALKKDRPARAYPRLAGRWRHTASTSHRGHCVRQGARL